MTQVAENSTADSLAIRGLFKPIIRFCLKRGLKFQEMTAILKSELREIALEELSRSGHEVNTSRMSLITGLQRKELKRLEGDNPSKRENVNLLSRIIGQWTTHPDFSTRGKAKRLTVEGNESEFVALVTSISADVNPYTVLFALEQSGMVTREGKKLKLKKAVYEFPGNIRQGIEMLARTAEGLFQAVDQNLAASVAPSTTVPNLHITTEYDNVCVDAVPKLREWLLDRGTTFHEEARAMIAKYDKDANPRLFKQKGGTRIQLSAFSSVQMPEETSDA